MNITYIIGVVAAFGVMVTGMMQGTEGFNPGQVMNFVDPASVFITIGCTIAVLIASFPVGTLKSIPKHFAVLMNTKKHDPLAVIEQLVELADRVVTMYQGRINAEFQKADINQDNLTSAAFGIVEQEAKGA